MKKYLYLFCVCMFYTHCAQAQILNFSVSGEALSLPHGFLDSLRNCTKYLKNITETEHGLVAQMQYQIDGLNTENKCHVLLKGSNNNGVNITQECLLTLEIAKEYSGALERFVQKKFRPRKSKEYDFILNDNDYAIAVDIIENPQNCQFRREKIDNTAEIRANLPACTPVEQIEKNGNLQIKRSILGMQNEVCRMAYKVVEYQEYSDKKNGFLPTEYSYVCEFNDKQKAEFAEILSAGVIPAEDGLDFSSVQRFDSKEEIAFVIKNCQLQLTE